jgi:hypothetical protein
MPDKIEIDPATVLALQLEPNDAEAGTVREYLVELLSTLWDQGEGFSGKRPFGNSGWTYDLYVPMVRAGLIGGTFYEDGDVKEVDRPAGNRLIAEAIRSLGATR